MTKKHKKTQPDPKDNRRAGILKPSEGSYTVFLPLQSKGSIVTSDYTNRAFISNINKKDILELKTSIENILQLEQPTPEPQAPKLPETSSEPVETEDLLF